MADQSRIDVLRRRVQKDPASIAFAQLAEECRRAGQYEESIEVCRVGLAIHPGYLSARVTLGRALIELNQLDDAQNALELVLKSAPENLAAIRGLAEIHHQRGSHPEALAQYRAALALARNDPDLQRTVAELARVVEPPEPPASADGLSFEQMQSEFMEHSPPPVVRLKPDATDSVRLPVQRSAEGKPDTTETLHAARSTEGPVLTSAEGRPDTTETLPAARPAVRLPVPRSAEGKPDATDMRPAPRSAEGRPDTTDIVEADFGRPSVDPFAFLEGSPSDSVQGGPFDFALGGDAPPLQSQEDIAARQLAMQTIAALERWLDAIHVTRAQRIA